MSAGVNELKTYRALLAATHAEQIAQLDLAIAKASAKEPDPTIEGRGKIEAGATAKARWNSSEAWIITAVSGDFYVCYYAGVTELFNRAQLVLLKSAELRAGCTVRHENGWQGFTKYHEGGLCVTWAGGLLPIGAGVNRINPANLTILHQPEGK